MDDRLPRDVLASGGIDRILELVSNRHRRLVLFMLEEGDTVSESDLEIRGTGERDSGRRSLRHAHLPKLEEADYIEWDRETREVTKGPRYDEVEPLLNLIRNHADELPPGWP